MITVRRSFVLVQPPVQRVLLALSLLLALVGCYSKPPANVQSSLSESPELLAINPSDIAVLPIEDGTSDRRATAHLELIRQEINRALVHKHYAPLTERAVDGQLATEASSMQRGSASDAAHLSRLAGKFGEDAVLGVRIQSWDESSLMANSRVRFSADVAMVDSKGRKLLWSGTFSGDVKAGGAGPAPLDREEKARAAAAAFASELIARLPSRRT